MSPKANKLTNSYKGTAIAALISLLFFALQYWKPSFYWNSPKTKFQRELIGDLRLDILVYGLVAMFVLGIIFRLLGVIFRLSSKHDSSKYSKE
jgi:TRAP-type C4-dicarboxylate transport system permease small subunit